MGPGLHQSARWDARDLIDPANQPTSPGRLGFLSASGRPPRCLPLAGICLMTPCVLDFSLASNECMCSLWELGVVFPHGQVRRE